MELQNCFIVNVYNVSVFSIYLVVVEKIHADFHDAREDYQDGGGDEEGVDVVKWPIFLFFGSCKQLEEGMSGSDLVSWNSDQGEVELWN